MRLFVHFFVIVFLTLITKIAFSVDVGDNLFAQITNLENSQNGPEDANFNDKAMVQSAVNDQKSLTVRYSSDEAADDAADDAAKGKIFKSKFEYLKTKNYPAGESSPKLPGYVLDPLMNFLRRTPQPSRRQLKPRRHGSTVKRKKDKDSDYISDSSSLEMEKWKDEWRHIWLGKKIQALNMTTPRGDVVNMAAARPWGIPCGDPNQHDMPWGTCMLPQECESEYRIYRGDFTCGRTTFVCCALQLNSYDMYQGFDASFATTSLETDSNEKRSREEDSHEKRKRKSKRDKKRRQRARMKRKRRIKRLLKKIIKQIRKLLNKSYKNGTAKRKKKTKILKKFIKDLKKKYKQDRHSVKQIHEIEIQKIDVALQNRLNQILGMNMDYVKNSTFRDIIVNGTITPTVARMLMESYPELRSVVTNHTRRSGSDRLGGDYLDYDIEYGLLYT